MKKASLLFTTLLLAFINILAQQRNTQTLRLRNDSLPHYRRPAATTPAARPPALQIYGVEVTAVPAGQGVYTLTIGYGVRNDSTVAVTLDKLLLQGYVVDQNKATQPLTNLVAYTPACGVAGGVATEVLQPGARSRKTFKCFNVSLTLANNPVYALTLKLLNDPSQQNVPFSRMDIPIRYE